MRPHSLRHGAATLMLTDAGLPQLVVSRILGHSSIAITADTYGHVGVDVLLEAARRVDQAVWGEASTA